MPSTDQDLLEPDCHVSAPSQAGPAAVGVTLEARHEQGLVGRLAVLLNAHEVTGFSYRVDSERQVATVEVLVLGGDQQVWRVARRLRRVIGVHRVSVHLAQDKGAEGFPSL